MNITNVVKTIDKLIKQSGRYQAGLEKLKDSIESDGISTRTRKKRKKSSLKKVKMS